VSLRLDGAIIPNGSGSYAASATYLTYTSPPITVVVAREGQKADLQSDGSARLGYTGPQLVPTNTRPTLTASIRQGLDPETDDTERLDFSRASVSAVFQIYPAACGTSCPAAVWTSGNIAIANSSTAGENGVATVVGPKLAQGSYLIVVSVNSNAYILPQVATSTLSVGTPSGTFLSGAGFIATDSTANAPVTSGLFGFSVKNGTPPAGDAVYVYRMRINPGDSTPISLVACTTLGTTCRDVDVIVRSTGITSITPNKSNSYPFVASAVGNALVQFVDAADGTTRYTALEISGATFRLDAYDASSGGSTDKFGLTVYKSGSVYHQAWIPVSGAIPQTGTSATTNQAVLAGGNITVH